MMLLCVIASSSCAFALGTDDVSTKISNNDGGILSMSYRGDTASFPKNSLEAIRSAEKSGADMISVSVAKTKDGVIVLAENGETDVESLIFEEVEKLFLKNNDGSDSKCTVVSLEKVMKRFMPKAVLVLDNGWDFKDEIAALCEETGSLEKVVLRTDAPAKEIVSWKQNGGLLPVIGVYDGNIVFSVLSHLSRLSQIGEKMVQYQSKNYFNVAFDNFSAKRYSSGRGARAVVSMYSKDLCGQREDNIVGWDEMVKRGFSVIETSDIEGLCAYIKNAEKENESLFSLYEKAKAVDTSAYSSVSAKNLELALKNAEASLSSKNTSLGQIQSSYSALVESLNNLTVDEQTDTQKGSLNITSGKIISVIIFGGLLLAGEIYLIKMRKKEQV